jgi:hypothetical protein
MKKTAPDLLKHIVLASAFGLFLAACFYVGWINEHLKGVIPDLHRGIVMVGFIIGAGSACSYLAKAAAKAIRPKGLAIRR